MKTPPLLMLATLLFWGWESNLLIYGAIAGVAIEASRMLKFRWDLEDVDFNRIFSFCMLVALALAAYVFTTNDIGGGVRGMFQGAAGLRNATASTSMAANSVLRWLPLIFFPFVAAQVYNERPTVPLTAVSIVLRIRRRRGEKSLAGRYVDISYIYFIFCIFAAGFHANTGTYSYFWGQAVLLLWLLWTLRSQRFSLKVWLGGLAVVIALGFSAQVGINGLERLVQRLDAEMFAKFFRSHTDPSQSMTSIGQIGELKLSPRIVIRLTPQQPGMAPEYLREASYRTYQVHNQTWQAGEAGNDFHSLLPERDSTTWLFLSNKVGTATVKIACYLNGRSSDGDPKGVLPLPSGSCRLLNLPYVNSVIALETNRTGVAMVTGSGLMIFDARYGPGQTIDSAPDTGTNQWDLKVPTNEIPALEQVITQLNVTNASDADKRLAVQYFFARNFTYSTWQRPSRRNTNNETPLTRFLLTTRTGHCEYFATATVLLLRQLGIPARYAVGYSVHEASGSGYVVRERDAHAWCIFWNRQTSEWEDFDTTPPSWVAIEGRNASWTDSLSDLRSWLVFQFEKFRWRQTDIRQYIIWSLTPVMVVLLYYIIFQRRNKRRSSSKKPSEDSNIIWPGHDSAFYRLEIALARRGLPRQPQEPLGGWLERVISEPTLASLRSPLRELLRLHYRYRFDPYGLTDAEKNLLMHDAAKVLAAVSEIAEGAADNHVRR